MADNPKAVLLGAAEHGLDRLVLPTAASTWRRSGWWGSAVVYQIYLRSFPDFADGRGEYGDLPPNNWRSIFGGSAWQRVTEPDGTPGQWYLHSFAPEQAWQPQPNWFADHAVDRQLSSGESMLHLYREALALRRRLSALASNELRWLRTEPGVPAFTRGDRFGCVVNCSSRVVSAPLNGELLLASHQEAGDKLPPNSAAWYLLAPLAAAAVDAA